MSIQYAGGTNVNTTFSNSSSPTRREIVDGIVAALTTAGWTTISGSGTGDVVQESATTPQGLVMRVRIDDPGSGNCARIRVQNQSGSYAQTYGIRLLPEAGKKWRVIANRYQCFVMVPGSTSARSFAAFGTLHIPNTLEGVITECIWAWGISNGDTDTATRPGLRTSMSSHANFNTPEMCFILNGSGWEVGNGTNVTSTSMGLPTLLFTQHSHFALANVPYAYRWHDDSSIFVEALMAFGGQSVVDEAKIRGQLWDAIISTDVYNAGTVIQFDSKNFYTITHNNLGSSTFAPRGTLCVVVP